MTTLESWQEAAFNAAGEALQSLDMSKAWFGVANHRDGKPFTTWTDHPHRKHATVWGYGATLSEAVADMFRELDKAREEKPPLTAAELKAAVKELVPTDYHEALDALPVEG